MPAALPPGYSPCNQAKLGGSPFDLAVRFPLVLNMEGSCI
jgi:hypothetical protein